MRSTDERMVYAVESDTPDNPPYRVDLLANGGKGGCSCRDWETRRSPAIKAGDPIGTPSTMCKHVVRARGYFLNGLLAMMAREEKT